MSILVAQLAQAMALVATPDDDRAMYSKFQSLTWVGQDNFDIRPELKDTGVCLVHECVAHVVIRWFRIIWRSQS